MKEDIKEQVMQTIENPIETMNDWKEELKKERWVRYLITLAAVILSALIQSYVLQVLARPAGLISGGFTGASMLIERLGELEGLNIPMQITMLALNLPVALLCCKGISLRFTAFSLIQVMLCSVFLEIFHFDPIFNDEFLEVIFGGVVWGASIVIALRGNASTGGTDFIALYISNKTGRSIWTWVFVGNALMYCIYGAFFGWKYAGYSIIFQYISTRMISAFHHRYDQVTLQITTSKGPEVIEAYIKVFRHGLSCVEGYGGYSKKEVYLLNTVISSYETQDAIRLIRKVDKKAIINVLKTEQFVGGFYRKPME